MTLIKIAYNKTFPSSIINELKSERELEDANSAINRKDALNSYISSSIIALSTCKSNLPPRNPGADWKTDSDEDFVNGIIDLTKTFNSVLNIILDTTNIKFTTGIYVSHFRGVNQENHPEPNQGTFLLRDDFDLDKTSTFRDIMENNSISGIGLEIQNGIKTAFNNGLFRTKKFKNHKDEDIILISINIQNLKNSNKQEGVIFIITKDIKNLPEDIESVLRMFSNIISHWFDLYEHEVIRRQTYFITQEAKELEEEEILSENTDNE
jgi:hypothetical protein